MATVTFGGHPVKLVGNEVKVGQTAPDFRAQNVALGEYTLGASSGKTRILASVPSLDTPVCDEETKRFNGVLCGNHLRPPGALAVTRHSLRLKQLCRKASCQVMSTRNRTAVLIRKPYNP